MGRNRGGGGGRDPPDRPHGGRQRDGAVRRARPMSRCRRRRAPGRGRAGDPPPRGPLRPRRPGPRAGTGRAPVLRPEPAEGDFLETAALQRAEERLERRALPTRVAEPWEDVTRRAVHRDRAAGRRRVRRPAGVLGGRGRRSPDPACRRHPVPRLLVARADAAGPFDAVFLPVNGAVVDLPHRQPPSPLPADMDPEQAALAASILDAGVAVPIHYDALQQAADLHAGRRPRRPLRSRPAPPPAWSAACSPPATPWT